MDDLVRGLVFSLVRFGCLHHRSSKEAFCGRPYISGRKEINTLGVARRLQVMAKDDMCTNVS